MPRSAWALAALAYYRGLGFGARQWRGGGYGFVTFDDAEIHPGGNVIRFGSPVNAD